MEKERYLKFAKYNICNGLKRELYQRWSKCDIGLVPSVLHNSSFWGRPIRTFIINEEGYHNHDYVQRFKFTNNPGRIQVFSQFSVPVVTDFTPSACQIIKDGESGFLVGAKEGWYCAIESLIKDYKLRNKFSKNLQLRFLEITPDISFSNLMTLIKDNYVNRKKTNKNLYESKEVVEKYSANSTRARSLNNAEKIFIDRYNIKDKKVLVLGCGAGRVPINLILYGNKVIGVDYSEKLYNFSITNFPKSKFPDLNFLLGDFTNLDSIENESFDVVIFPMNSIDQVSFDQRDKALLEANKKLKKGGLLVFSSHNKLAYIFSYKVPISHLVFRSFFKKFLFSKEKVVGGGYIFRGNPKFIIKHTVKVTGNKYCGFVCDVRGKVDNSLSKRLNAAQFVFPYLIYIFKK
jgi:ubiquinone/menaquinone biosynthesis C-methylase UbiE